MANITFTHLLLITTLNVVKFDRLCRRNEKSDGKEEIPRAEVLSESLGHEIPL